MRIFILFLIIGFTIASAKYLQPDPSKSNVLWRSKRSDSDESTSSIEHESDQRDDDDYDNNSNDDERDRSHRQQLKYRQKQEKERLKWLEKLEHEPLQEEKEQKRVRENINREARKEQQRRDNEEKKQKQKIEEDERKEQEKLERDERKQQEEKRRQQEKIQKEESKQKKLLEKIEKEKRKQERREKKLLEHLHKEELKKQHKQQVELTKLKNELLETSEENDFLETEEESSVELEDIWRNYIYAKYDLTISSTKQQKQDALNKYMQEELGLGPNSTSTEHRLAIIKIIQTKLESDPATRESLRNYITRQVTPSAIENLRISLEEDIKELENKTELLNNINLPWTAQAKQNVEDKTTFMKTIVAYLSDLQANLTKGGQKVSYSTVSKDNNLSSSGKSGLPSKNNTDSVENASSSIFSSPSSSDTLTGNNNTPLPIDHTVTSTSKPKTNDVGNVSYVSSGENKVIVESDTAVSPSSHINDISVPSTNIGYDIITPPEIKNNLFVASTAEFSKSYPENQGSNDVISTQNGTFMSTEKKSVHKNTVQTIINSEYSPSANGVTKNLETNTLPFIVETSINVSEDPIIKLVTSTSSSRKSDVNGVVKSTDSGSNGGSIENPTGNVAPINVPSLHAIDSSNVKTIANNNVIENSIDIESTVPGNSTFLLNQANKSTTNNNIEHTLVEKNIITTTSSLLITTENGVSLNVNTIDGSSGIGNGVIIIDDSKNFPVKVDPLDSNTKISGSLSDVTHINTENAVISSNEHKLSINTAPVALPETITGTNVDQVPDSNLTKSQIAQVNISSDGGLVNTAHVTPVINSIITENADTVVPTSDSIINVVNINTLPVTEDDAAIKTDTEQITNNLIQSDDTNVSTGLNIGTVNNVPDTPVTVSITVQNEDTTIPSRDSATPILNINTLPVTLSDFITFKNTEKVTDNIIKSDATIINTDPSVNSAYNIPAVAVTGRFENTGTVVPDIDSATTVLSINTMPVVVPDAVTPTKYEQVANNLNASSGTSSTNNVPEIPITDLTTIENESTGVPSIDNSRTVISSTTTSVTVPEMTRATHIEQISNDNLNKTDTTIINTGTGISLANNIPKTLVESTVTIENAGFGVQSLGKTTTTPGIKTTPVATTVTSIELASLDNLTNLSNSTRLNKDSGISSSSNVPKTPIIENAVAEVQSLDNVTTILSINTTPLAVSEVTVVANIDKVTNDSLINIEVTNLNTDLGIGSSNNVPEVIVTDSGVQGRDNPITVSNINTTSIIVPEDTIATDIEKVTNDNLTERNTTLNTIPAAVPETTTVTNIEQVTNDKLIFSDATNVNTGSDIGSNNNVQETPLTDAIAIENLTTITVSESTIGIDVEQVTNSNLMKSDTTAVKTGFNIGSTNNVSKIPASIPNIKNITTILSINAVPVAAPEATTVTHIEPFINDNLTTMIINTDTNIGSAIEVTATPVTENMLTLVTESFLANTVASDSTINVENSTTNSSDPNASLIVAVSLPENVVTSTNLEAKTEGYPSDTFTIPVESGAAVVDVTSQS